MPRTGRPKVDDPKYNKITARLSNEQLANLEAYATKHHLKKAQVLAKGLEELLRQDAEAEMKK